MSPSPPHVLLLCPWLSSIFLAFPPFVWPRWWQLDELDVTPWVGWGWLEEQGGRQRSAGGLLPRWRSTVEEMGRRRGERRSRVGGKGAQ